MPHAESQGQVRREDFTSEKTDVLAAENATVFTEKPTTFTSVTYLDRLLVSIANDPDGKFCKELMRKFALKRCDNSLPHLIMRTYHSEWECAPVRCACKAQEPHFWKRHHPPLPVSKEDVKLSLVHIFEVMSSITQFGKHKFEHLANIVSQHCLINPLYLISNTDAPGFCRIYYDILKTSNPRYSPIIDCIKTISPDILPKDISKTIIPEMNVVVAHMDSLRDMFSSGTHLREFKESVAAFKDEGIKIEMPDIAGFAEKISNANVTINMPDLKDFSDTIKGGIKHEVQIPFYEKMLSVFSEFFSPIKDLLSTLKAVSSEHRDLLCILTMVTLEGIRLGFAKSSKYCHIIIGINAAIAYTLGSTAVQTFAIGYYGVKILIMAKDYFFNGDDEDEAIQAVPHFDANVKSLLESFIAFLTTSVTGITNIFCLRDIVLSLTSYRLLVNGAAFAVDSIVNLTIDFFNLMGTPFGLKIFKRAYSKYPILYELIEGLNGIKDKLTKGQEILKSDVDLYVRIKEDIRTLEGSIPLEKTVYRNILINLNKQLDYLDDSLRCLGFLDSRKRQAPFTVSLMGCSGSCKTRLATMLADNLLFLAYGREKFEYYKSFQDAYFYSFKSGKKHHDSFSNTTKVVIIDDMGQVIKAIDPENCPWVNLVFMGNNEPFSLPVATLQKKDKTQYAPEIQIITSNLKSYPKDSSWCTEPEAPIRRMETNNNCVFAFVPNAEYQKVDSTSNWGYRTTAELRQKTKLDVDAFKIHRMDFRTGKFLTGQSYTWQEFNKLVGKNFMDWRESELAKSKTDAKSYLDPVLNPFFDSAEPSTSVSAHMDSYSDPRFVESMDLSGLSREDLLKVLLHQERIKRKPSFPPLDGGVSSAELAVTIEKYYEDKLKAYYAKGGTTFISETSRIIWCSLGDDEFAEYLSEEKRKFGHYSANQFGVNGGMLFSPELFADLGTGTDFTSGFQAIYKGCIDIYRKIKRLCTTMNISIEKAMDAISRATNSREFGRTTVDEFWNVMKVFYLMSMDTAWTIYSVFTINNYWCSLVGGFASSLIFAGKSVEAAAHADYQKLGRVLRDPLSAKCKHSKMIKKVCSCTECHHLRETHKMQSSSMSGIPKFECFNLNAEEKAKNIAKRNVWSARLIRCSTDEEPLVANNITFASAEIGITNHHFLKYCQEVCKTYPNALIRLGNWNDSRRYDVLFRSMRWDERPTEDKAYWINDDLCSFGGGIRDITSLFLSASAPVFSHGRMVKMKFCREDNLMEFQCIPTDVSSQRVVYDSNGMKYDVMAYSLTTATTVGHCGAPVLTADTTVKEPKIFAIICSGDKPGKGRSHSYAVSVYKEEILALKEKHSLRGFDTSNLPMEVSTTEVVPHGCLIWKQEHDDHSIASNNPIKKTALYGCLGDLDRIPTFLAPWLRFDGEVLDPMFKVRAKYITNGPAINPHVYRQAAVMHATAISSYLGGDSRSFRLSTTEAIEGARDESRFSTKTSPGGKYILQGIRKQDIVTLNGDQLDFSSKYGQQFLRDVDKATLERENGVISFAYTNEFPKSEVLPKDKVSDGKVRLVNGDDADQVIADKKELACVAYLMKKVSIASGNCIGKDPLSNDYDLMAKLLMIWNNIIPGDHSGWDTTFFRYKFKAMLIFLRIVLYDITPIHWRAIETCVENMMYRMHIAHIRYNTVTDEELSVRVFYELMHGMISGAYATLIFNTIGHGTDMRYMILCLYLQEVAGIHYLDYDPVIHGMLPIMALESNFVCFILGDDVALSVSKHMEYINFMNLKNMFMLHNMKFTTDKKDDEDSSYLKIKRYDTDPADFSFCKRTPKWCPEYSRYIWVLDKSSLLKSVYYSEDFNDYKQVVDTFYKEYSGYGKSSFENDLQPFTRALAVEYRYTSPFSCYEIALMGALGGMSQKHGLLLFCAVESKLLDPEDIKFLAEFDIQKYPFSKLSDLESDCYTSSIDSVEA